MAFRFKPTGMSGAVYRGRPGTAPGQAPPQQGWPTAGTYPPQAGGQTQQPPRLDLGQGSGRGVAAPGKFGGVMPMPAPTGPGSWMGAPPPEMGGNGGMAPTWNVTLGRWETTQYGTGDSYYYNPASGTWVRLPR